MPIPEFRLTGPLWLGDPHDKPLILQASDGQNPLLDVGNTLAFPGLVNSHDHLEFNCYPPLGNPPYADFLAWGPDVHRDNRQLITSVERLPRSTRIEIGILKNLLWGVTHVVHHGDRVSAGTSANVEIISRLDTLHSPELQRWASFEFLKFWRKQPVVAHLAEGRTEESRQRALNFIRLNRFRRKLIGVHGVALEGADFATLDALVWCPAANFFLLGQTADIAAAKRHTTVLFGTDATISAPGTIWDHLRMARGLGQLSDAELFESLTGAPQRIWRLSSRANDLVVARRSEDNVWNAFFSITPKDILLVIRSGRVVLADPQLANEYPKICASLTPLNVGAMTKCVAVDCTRLRFELGDLAPPVDFESVIGRLAGA